MSEDSLLERVTAAVEERHLSQNTLTAYQRTWLKLIAWAAAEGLALETLPSERAGEFYKETTRGRSASHHFQVKAALGLLYHVLGSTNPFAECPAPKFSPEKIELRCDTASQLGRLLHELRNLFVRGRSPKEPLTWRRAVISTPLVGSWIVGFARGVVRVFAKFKGPWQNRSRKKKNRPTLNTKLRILPAGKGIVIFLIITFALSSIFYALISWRRAALYTTGLMWCPALGALLTCLLLRRNIAGLGWKWGNSRYQLVSYLVPIAFLFVPYVVVWLSGLGGFPNPEFVQEISGRYGWEQLPTGLIVTLYVLMNGTIGMVRGTATALGEEIGWRGFLVPELARVTTFTKTAAISGLVWALWHYPVTPTLYASVGTPLWYQLTWFTVLAIGVSFALAWVRLMSGSLWTAAFFHASYNIFAQSIFTPLTTDTGITEYLIGDLGAAVAVAGAMVGFIFWRKRSAVEGKQGERASGVLVEFGQSNANADNWKL